MLVHHPLDCTSRGLVLLRKVFVQIDIKLSVDVLHTKLGISDFLSIVFYPSQLAFGASVCGTVKFILKTKKTLLFSIASGLTNGSHDIDQVL